MALKTKKVNLGFREITLREMSFPAVLRIQRIEKPVLEDYFREMLSPEDFKALEDLPERESKLLMEAFNELAGKGESPL